MKIKDNEEMDKVETVIKKDNKDIGMIICGG